MSPTPNSRSRLPGFSVDTKLFRELGELLVGRDSTALIELIKNAYDADATEVTILGRNLGSTRLGKIIVSDNGVGMTEDEFSRGFLRIAGRSKTAADRRSPWFRRRYTGEKGVGRLAAHKLARALRVTSCRWNGKIRDDLTGFPAEGEVRARINWDAIERLETFSEIEKSGAVRLNYAPNIKSSARTQLTLSPLRKAWSETDRRRFFDEVATLTPPHVLTGELSRAVVDRPVLNKTMQIRDELRGGSFQINYAGDLQLSEADLPAAAESASWVIEIDCNRETRKLRIAVEPTKQTKANFANAEGFSVDRNLEADEPSVGFQARIFQRAYESWPTRYRGIRVYYEGFRVLPYGDPRDDWLDLDRDYRSRGAAELGRLRSRSAWELPNGIAQEGLSVQGNSAFFGAVLLTRNGADDLQMLVNREGFLPSNQFDFINDTVRLAIDLQVRLRYAATSEVKQARKIAATRQTRAARRAASGQSPSAFLLQELQNTALESLHNARTGLAAGRTAEVVAELSTLQDALSEAAELTGEAASEATMFRVVASLGLEHAAFVHEVRGLVLGAQTLVDTLQKMATTSRDKLLAPRLRAAVVEANELRERLRRNAIYLADVTGVEGRRRRSRQGLSDRADRVIGFFAAAAAKRGIEVRNDIPTDVQTPPIFPAELTAILSNLISNAIKFAGKNGIVKISSSQDDLSLLIRVENTGQGVDLATAERWFEPYRSTTSEIDESLGQGMGLGLTVTRSLLDEYGGQVFFIKPTIPFATAVEVELPKR